MNHYQSEPMQQGITVSLNELIALRRFVKPGQFTPKGQGKRLGEHLSSFRGRGMAFSEVRHYQAMDDVRHMDWRVTARTGKPHIKVYQEEQERPVVLLTDFNPSMYFGTRTAFKSVITAKLATLIAWSVIEAGDRVGALLFSSNHHNELPPRARAHGVLPLLAALSQYTSYYNTKQALARPLNEMLLRLRRVLRPGSIIVIISDGYQMNDEAIKQLARLRASSDILFYHVNDPLELSPPMPSQYVISNGQKTLLLDTFDAGVVESYQQICHARIASLKALCLSLQIQYIPVKTTDNIVRIVHTTFPRKQHG